MDAPIPILARRPEILNATTFAACVEGWYFVVPDAFADALDIRHAFVVDRAATKRRLAALATDKTIDKRALRAYVIRRHALKRGSPPAISFREGDTLHSSDGKWIVQIRAVNSNLGIAAGCVAFGLYGCHLWRAPTLEERCECGQQQFAEMLQTGLLNGTQLRSRRFRIRNAVKGMTWKIGISMLTQFARRAARLDKLTS